MQVSLSDVRIEENDSKAYFDLVIINPSRIHLEVYFLRTEVYFNNSYVDEREMGFHLKPLALPTNVGTDLMVTLPLSNQTSYLDGIWRLNLRFILETPLPQRGGYKTVLEK